MSSPCATRNCPNSVLLAGEICGECLDLMAAILCGAEGEGMQEGAD